MLVNRRVLAIDDDFGCHTLFQMLAMSDRRRGSAESVLAEMNAVLGELGLSTQAAASGAFAERFHIGIDICETGQHGLQLVSRALELGDPYALIICDICLPGWDGVRTIREIRAVDPRCEVLLISGHHDYDLRSLHTELGLRISFLSKPFLDVELEQALLRAVLSYNIRFIRERLLREFYSCVRYSCPDLLTQFATKLGWWLEALYIGWVANGPVLELVDLTQGDRGVWSEDQINNFIAEGVDLKIIPAKGRSLSPLLLISLGPDQGVLLVRLQRELDALQEAILQEILCELQGVMKVLILVASVTEGTSQSKRVCGADWRS